MAIKITAYRGEHGKPNAERLQTRLGAISFGSVEAAKLYAQHPNNRADEVFESRVIKAELIITNPVMNNPHDPFIDLSIIADAIGLEKAKTIAIELKDHIFNTDNWGDLAEEYECETIDELFVKMGARAALEAIYIDAYPVFDENKYVQWFRDAGYDGLVQGGNGATACEPEYKIFSPEQARILSVVSLKEREHELDDEPALTA